MAGDDKKVKTSPAAKSDAAVTKKPDTPTADKGATDTAPSTSESSEKPAISPASYSRGEGQKAVTQAYKDNWNAIFGGKKKKR